MTNESLPGARARLEDLIGTGAGPGVVRPQVMAAVAEALSRDGREPSDETMAAFETWEPGGTVVQASATVAEVADVAAAYWSVLARQRVHLVAIDHAAAQRRADRIGPVLDGLGVRYALRGNGEVHLRRQAYAAEVTFGGFRDFMQDYLMDHLVVTEAEVAQGHLDVAFLEDIEKILLDAATQESVNASTGHPRPIVNAKIGVRDYFGQYRRLGGTSSVAESAADELREVYGLRLVVSAKTVASHPLRSVTRIPRIASPFRVHSGSEAAREARRLQYELDVVESRQYLQVCQDRDRVLRGEDISSRVQQAIVETVTRIAASTADPEVVVNTVSKLYPCAVDVNLLRSRDDLTARLLADVDRAYQARQQLVDLDVFATFQQNVLLRVMDVHWRDYLKQLELARELTLAAEDRSAAIVEYHADIRGRFATMQQLISRDVMGYVFNAPIDLRQ